ncbi:MAG: VCBS repeat-containing protein, partial [Pseudomonadota bacterium]
MNNAVRRLTAGVAVAAAASSVAHAQSFTDVTVRAGVSFEHRPTADHRSGPMSGGGAVGDVNGDGFPDLFVLGSGETPDALFINQRNGRFVNQAEAYGLAEPHRGTGAAFADVDSDGDLDLFVTSFGDSDLLLPGTGHHRLYRNDGGRFVDVAPASGVNFSATDAPDGYGATFGDIDLDGDLDLFVAGWHVLGVGNAYGSRLFRNRGDGTFEDISETAGILGSSTQAFGAAFQDMDGDFYPELVVAGDFGTTRYLRNNRNGTFTELDPGTGAPVTLPTDPNWSIGKAHNGMGLAVGDVDGDLRPD